MFDVVLRLIEMCVSSLELYIIYHLDYSLALLYIVKYQIIENL